MENKETTTYTSPATGVTYEVIFTNTYDWSRWEILKDGRLVQFALTEAQVPAQVRHLEQPGWDGWVSSARD
jgi:hypothetical protein